MVTSVIVHPYDELLLAIKIVHKNFNDTEKCSWYNQVEK